MIGCPVCENEAWREILAEKKASPVLMGFFSRYIKGVFCDEHKVEVAAYIVKGDAS